MPLRWWRWLPSPGSSPQYTTEAVAALGIVKKLDQLPLYFSIGVSNGLLPLLAYHYAAGQQEKRRAAFRLGAGISLLFALVCLVLFEGFAPSWPPCSSTTPPPFTTPPGSCGGWSSPCP